MDYKEIRFHYISQTSRQLLEYLEPYIEPVIPLTMKRICSSSILSIASKVSVPPLVPLAINAKRGRYSYLLKTVGGDTDDEDLQNMEAERYVDKYVRTFVDSVASSGG
uniref:Tubulin gamma chain n=1 Tax=Lygus hesperus TaxID=30085 RepID=A0A0A9Y2X3_LYGHE